MNLLKILGYSAFGLIFSFLLFYTLIVWDTSIFTIIGSISLGLFIIIPALLFLLYLPFHILHLIKQEKAQSKLHSFFKDDSIKKPRLKLTNEYGFPHYAIIFDTLEDMRTANDRMYIKEYKKFINQQHKGLTIGERSFDAEHGVYITYKERWHD